MFFTNPGRQGILLEDISESRTETRRRRQFMTADDASCADNTIHDRPITPTEAELLALSQVAKGEFLPG